MANTSEMWRGVGIHVEHDEKGNLVANGQVLPRIKADLRDWVAVRKAEKALKQAIKRAQPRYRGPKMRGTTFADPIHVAWGDNDQREGIDSTCN